MLCKGGHQLVARGAARCCVLVPVEAEAADLAHGGAARHVAGAQMRKMIAKEMCALGREQPRRGAVAAIGVEEDERVRRRRAEMVELILAGEYVRSPFVQVAE